MNIYDSNELQQWDAYTIKHEPIRSIDLMERAAQRCTNYILSHFSYDNYTIVCGLGNNGGDGLAIARMLFNASKSVEVVILKYANQNSADFTANLERLPKPIRVTWLEEQNYSYGFKGKHIVEGIFGTALNKRIKGWLKHMVQQINAESKSIVSIDIPSGLFVLDNSSNDLESVIKVDYTLSIQGPKCAFSTKSMRPM